MRLRRVPAAALTLSLGPLMFAAPGPALAAPSPEVQAVLACRSIADDAAQLACFRRAAEALAAPSAETQQAAAAPPPAPFGARAPRPPKPPKSAQVRRITLKLVSLSNPGDSHAVLVFADGSVWREIDTAPLAGSLQPGQTVQIEKGALGSYLLDVPHSAAVHVRRLKG
jgi:hypothetical protein